MNNMIYNSNVLLSALAFFKKYLNQVVLIIKGIILFFGEISGFDMTSIYKGTQSVPMLN